MESIVSIVTDKKKILRTVTLHVERNTPGQTQVLGSPITKIVMLVGNNEFDSPTEEVKQNFQDGSPLGEAR